MTGSASSNLQADQEKLRSLTREAHEAIKDLRLLLREVDGKQKELEQARQALADDIVAVINDEFEDVMEKAAKAQIDGMAVATSAAILKTEEAIFDRFDTIARLLLGEDEETTILQEAKRVRYLREQKKLREERAGRIEP